MKSTKDTSVTGYRGSFAGVNKPPEIEPLCESTVEVSVSLFG